MRKVSKGIVRLALAVLFVMQFAAVAASSASKVSETESADTKSRETWVLGYMKLQSAAEAEIKNNLVDALGLYQESRDIFQQVKNDNPTWQVELVNFRLQHCNTKINRLQAMIASKDEDLSKEDILALNRRLQEENASLQDDIRMLREGQLEQIRELRVLVSAFEERLASMGQSNQALADEVQKLIKERNEAVSRLERSLQE